MKTFYSKTRNTCRTHRNFHRRHDACVCERRDVCVGKWSASGASVLVYGQIENSFNIFAFSRLRAHAITLFILFVDIPCDVRGRCSHSPACHTHTRDANAAIGRERLANETKTDEKKPHNQIDGKERFRNVCLISACAGWRAGVQRVKRLVHAIMHS